MTDISPEFNYPTLPHLRATRSAWTHWSWYDVARTVGGGLLGALAGAVLLVWCTPDAGRAVTTGLWLRRLLCAALPLTLGLCLAEGHLRRAREAWLRAAGTAVLWAAGGCLLLVALGVLLPHIRWEAVIPWLTALHVPFWVRGPLLWLAALPAHLSTEVVAWGLCAVVVSLAFARGFPGARHPGQTLAAGLLAGVLLGALLPALLPDALPAGTAGRWLYALAVLLPAGGLLGFCHAVVREWGKRQWLLVLFGDHPGRHYPLYDAPLTLGTAPDNTLVLDVTGGVRPHHAIIRREDGRVLIAPIVPEALVVLCDRRADVSELFDGNDLQIGETVVRYYSVPDR